MDRNAFIAKQPPRQLDEIWEMEEETENPKGTKPFTAEEKRIHHILKFSKTIFYMQINFYYGHLNKIRLTRNPEPFNCHESLLWEGFVTPIYTHSRSHPFPITHSENRKLNASGPQPILT